jgi:hypothetical protein
MSSHIGYLALVLLLFFFWFDLSFSFTYVHAYVLFIAYMAVYDFYFFLQERAQSALRAHSSSTRGMSKRLSEVPQASIAIAPKTQSFIKEEVLVSIFNV